MTEQRISLRRLELYLLDLPQKSVFKSGIGLRKSKETLIVKWIDTEGREGYGECSCRPDPYYSAEFLKASLLLIQDFIAPKLDSTFTYNELLKVLKQIRGWNFTKSAVESAAFQIAKQVNPSFELSNVLKASAIDTIPVGISLGIYEDKEHLFGIVQEAIEDGYQRVKFKLSPSMDTKVFEHITPMLKAHKVRVSFDANGSYQMDDLSKLSYFIQSFPEAYFEQLTPPDRFDVCLKAKTLFPNLKICFDEEVKNIGDLIKLKSLNIIDELNLKIGRVGGLTNSVEIINYCHAHDIPCWIGGMFETGIGRLQNLELAAFLPKAAAHDLSPSSRYFKEDIVAPEIKMEKGFINLEAARLSHPIQEKIDKYTTQKIVLKK